VANQVMTTAQLNFPDAKDTNSAAPLFQIAQSNNDFSLRFTGEQLMLLVRCYNAGLGPPTSVCPGVG
jgi:hypothetical protein